MLQVLHDPISNRNGSDGTTHRIGTLLFDSFRNGRNLLHTDGRFLMALKMPVISFCRSNGSNAIPFLYHQQRSFYNFIGREPLTTSGTLSSPPDFIFCRTGVQHSGILCTTKRALHRFIPPYYSFVSYAAIYDSCAASPVMYEIHCGKVPT